MSIGFSESELAEIFSEPNTYLKTIKAQEIKDRGFVDIEYFVTWNDKNPPPILPNKSENDYGAQYHFRYKGDDALKRATDQAKDVTTLLSDMDAEAVVYKDGNLSTSKYYKNGKEVDKSETDFI